MTISILHVGVGPIGCQVAKLVGTREAFHSIGAVDLDPALAGRALAEVVGTGHGEARIVSDLDQIPPGSGKRVAIHCAGSSLDRAAPLFTALMKAGYHVVSTCEELADPWHTQPELAQRLDKTARECDVVLLGTGVNPGYAMDYLPIVLAGSQISVRTVRVHRIQDAATRRLPLQRKVGVGLTNDSFRELVATGAIRHVGLPESARMLDRALALGCGDYKETIEPVIAAQATKVDDRVIPAGHVLGIDQCVIGMRDGAEVINLRLQMAAGLADPRDEIVLDGEPGIRTVVHGLHGDYATAAVVVNSIGRMLATPAGLRTVTDLPAAPLHLGRRI